MTSYVTLHRQVRELQDWRAEVCDQFGYDADEPGAADEVLTFLPYWRGQSDGYREYIETLRTLAEPLKCGGGWIDKGEPICGVHDHLWPDGQRWCNEIESTPSLREVLSLLYPEGTTKETEDANADQPDA